MISTLPRAKIRKPASKALGLPPLGKRNHLISSDNRKSQRSIPLQSPMFQPTPVVNSGVEK